MDEDQIERLRRDQKLPVLPDGSAGVPISVQYRGEVPPLPRAERKRWLLEHFNGLEHKLSHLGIHVNPETISVSGQTVEGICSVERLDEIRKEVDSEQHAVNIVRPLHVAS